MCLGCQLCPNRKGAVPPAPQFWGSLLFMRIPFDAAAANLMWKNVGVGIVYRASHAPTPRRQDPSAPQFWGFLSYTLYCKTIKFDVVTNTGRCLF